MNTKEFITQDPGIIDDPNLGPFTDTNILIERGEYPGSEEIARASSIKRIPAGELVAAHPHERDFVIVGLLREGETANIVASPKTYKSFLALMAALCVSTGRALFNLYQTKQSRVLLIDNELHRETIAHRIPRVAEALGILSEEWADAIDVVSLRGDLRDIHQLGELFRTIERGEYGLIILDALYRAWPAECDENSNSDVVKIYNTIDRHAAKTGAAILIVHHSSKGVQGGKSVTDTGAGAGAQSRAADAHVVIRPHEEDGCAVLEAVLRSSPPIAPLGLRWSYPRWTPDPSIDVTKLKRERGNGGRPRKAETKPEDANTAEAWTPERFAKEFVTDAPRSKELITAKATTAGIAGREVANLILLAEDAQLIHRHKMEATRTVYLSTSPQSEMFSVSARTNKTHARTPHTPHVRRKSGRTGGGN